MSFPQVWRKAESAPKTGEAFLAWFAQDFEGKPQFHPCAVVRWFPLVDSFVLDFRGMHPLVQPFLYWMPLPKPPRWRRAKP